MPWRCRRRYPNAADGRQRRPQKNDIALWYILYAHSDHYGDETPTPGARNPQQKCVLEVAIASSGALRFAVF